MTATDWHQYHEAYEGRPEARWPMVDDIAMAESAIRHLLIAVESKSGLSDAIHGARAFLNRHFNGDNPAPELLHGLAPEHRQP